MCDITIDNKDIGGKDYFPSDMQQALDKETSQNK